MKNLSLLQESILHTEYDPAIRISMIRESGFMLCEYVGGSFCYGTNVPESDRDARGVFCLPRSYYLGTTEPINQVSDDRKLEGKPKNDDILYTFRRFFELLKGSNPNILEALYLPSDCVISSSPEMERVVANRHLFISKKCVGTHCGYAFEQVKRAKGKNKKVHNPCPKERPQKKDFCRIIPCIPGTKPWTNPDVPTASKFPFRPVPLKDMPWIDLKDYHVAAVEHMKDSYRLYCYYGDPACKGVFRGDDMLVCESIPMDDEHARFSGILLYSEQEFQKALTDWKSYHEWIANRNESRWINQEKGILTFDQKNMAHCMRLLMSGLNVVLNGEPLVRLSGKQLEKVMAIRTGKVTSYDDIMQDINEKMEELKAAELTSSLPENIDCQAIEALYNEVAEMAWNRLA